jgi:hypothetical protein
MSIECPIECIWRETPPSWLETHGSWTLTMVGMIGGGLTVLLSYCLRSRCTRIRCWGIGCHRTPLTVDEIEVIQAS